MEIHSFRFLSQMLSSKVTHVVFIPPDSSEQLVCGVESLDFCLPQASAHARVFTYGQITFFIYFFSIPALACVKSKCPPPLRFARREKRVSEPMPHTQQPCPIEIDWSHSGRVILACVCRPAVIFVAQRASSGFSGSSYFFVHNEINSSVASQGSCCFSSAFLSLNQV